MSDVYDNPTENPDDTTKVTTEDWRESIAAIAPEYVSQWDEFKNADSPDKFFKQMADHRSMLGQSVRIPGQDAGEEQYKEFYTKLQSKVPGLMRTPNPDDPEQVKDALRKLGMPEKPDDYKIADDIGLRDGSLQDYKVLAHEAGLTQAQFREFVKRVGERTAREQAEAEEREQANVGELKREWGQAFEQRLELCAKIAEKTGAPEALVNAVKEGKADAGTMKWLHGLAGQFGSEGMNFGQDQPAIAAPDDLRGQISDIMANGEHPYWNSSHPDHGRAVEKMLNLRRKLVESEQYAQGAA